MARISSVKSGVVAAGSARVDGAGGRGAVRRSVVVSAPAVLAAPAVSVLLVRKAPLQK